VRIIVNGQQAFGRSVLEALLDRGKDQVVGVYSAPDKEGRKVDPLKEIAVERGIPVFQPKSFRKPEVWEQMKKLNPDLGVMAYVTLFVPEEALNVPARGTIQYHPSLLPRHRGPSSINWPIIWGETKTGLSIFWPDNGLDTGPILLQKEVEIRDDDTLGSIYFDHLFPMGIEAMLEAIDLVRDGKTPKIPQDDSQATYEGWCRRENVEIDWSKPLQEVWNLVRGANPQPGAWTRHAGQTVQIYDARKQPGRTEGQPGEVTAVTDAGMVVAAGDGALEVQRMRIDGGKKAAAAEVATGAGIKVGTQLGR
jgi:methionyl-tRNA formyltransferase